MHFGVSVHAFWRLRACHLGVSEHTVPSLVILVMLSCRTICDHGLDCFG